MASGQAGKGMGNGVNHGGRPGPVGEMDETDLSAELQGDNQLQGNDQVDVHNQRHAVPGVNTDADSSIVETLEKAEKRGRAGKENEADNDGGDRASGDASSGRRQP